MLEAIEAHQTKKRLRKIMGLFPEGKSSRDINERNRINDSGDDS